MNEITVIERSTGDEVTILAADFDDSIHKRKEAARSAEGGSDLVGAIREMTATLTKTVGESVSTAVKDAVRSGGRNPVHGGGVGDGIDDGGTVTGDLGEFGRAGMNDGQKHMARSLKVAAGEAARCLPGWTARYNSLPEDMKGVRTPEGDICIQLWARGMAERGRDGELSQSLIRQSLDLFQGGTATRAEMNEHVARALTTATSSGGGLVPQPLGNAVAVQQAKRERIAPRSARFTSESETIRLPYEGDVLAATQYAQNATITADDGTFPEIQLTKQSTKVLTYLSYQLTTDLSSAFSVANLLTNQAARAFAANFDVQAAQSGNGTPPNHTNSLATSITATDIAAIATGATMSRAAILLLYYGLPSEWRDSSDCVLMGNSDVTALIGALDDNGDGTGRPIYAPRNDAARPLSDVGNATNVVEGLPYLEVPFTTDYLVIGSLSDGFAVLDDGGLRVDTSMSGGTAWTADQVSYRFVQRRDSAVWNASAFRVSATFTG